MKILWIIVLVAVVAIVVVARWGCTYRCPRCKKGHMRYVGTTRDGRINKYRCDLCGYEETFNDGNID